MRVEIRSQRRLFDDFFKIDEAHLEYERFDGSMSENVRRLVFNRGDSVAAVILDRSTDRLILTNQFRYPTYEKGPGWLIELVAGSFTPDESPELAIKREIHEELGYRVKSVEHVSTFYVSPGGTSERIVLYYAEVTDDLREGPGGGVATEGEDIELVTMRLDDALARIGSGGIVDAKTIVGILWLANRVKR
jgi:nudix-type nucleoside diphosphatase (YffH/AdpP family)